MQLSSITVLFGSFFILLLLNIPVPYVLGLSSVITLLWRGGLDLMLIPQRIVPAIDSFALLAIPLYILAGEVIGYGSGKRLIRFADELIGHITGGLAHANILASVFFGGISGSASADTAAIGSIMIPQMEEAGYDRAFATAVTITSSPLATIIPPSITMVLYSWMTGVPVSEVFVAGFIPGLLMAFGLMVISYWASKKYGYGYRRRFDFRRLVKTFVESIPALVMPLIILGGIFSGIFTATEAGAVAVVYGLIIGLFVYKEIKLSDLPRIFMNTCATTGGVMLLLSLTAAFGWVMTVEQIPLQLTQFFMSFTPNGLVFLLVVIVIALIVGCFLTPTAALAIMVPILTPIAQGFGINLLHFGLVLLPALSLGHFTPPVGLCLYIGSSISGIPIAKLTRPVLPFLLAMVTVCVLLAVFPQISLFLPRLFFR